MDSQYLVHLVMAGANKNAYQPPLKAILEKYYELFRGKGSGEAGGSADDEDLQADFEGEDAMWNLRAHPQWQ